MMPIGTRTLLFGVHHFFLHGFLVWLAWRRIYGVTPSWREAVAIFFHDYGYVGKPDLDGELGQLHPDLSARIVRLLFKDPEIEYLVRFHSRAYTQEHGNAQLSALALPDKLSLLLYPKTLYLVLARASGEINEYKIRMNLKHLSDTAWLEHTKQLAFDWAVANTPLQYKERLHSHFASKVSNKPQLIPAWSSRFAKRWSSLPTRLQRRRQNTGAIARIFSADTRPTAG